MTRGPEAAPDVAARTSAIFEEMNRRAHEQTDRFFLVLMPAQWLAGIGLAAWVSPRSWEGLSSQLHPHVWAALVLGALFSSLPLALILRCPGRAFTRHAVAAGQMLTSALLIHLTGGRIETHFHVFGSLAFLSFYRDRNIIATATLVVAADHLLRGAFWPESVYGVLNASGWRWLEHAGWVVFEDVFLLAAMAGHTRLMWQTARRQAVLEETNAELSWSEGRFNTLSASSPMGILMLGPKGECLYANERAQSISGLPLAECLGDGWARAVHPDDRELVRKRLDEAIGGQKEFSLQHRLVAPDRISWVHVRITPLKTAAGISGFVGQIEDLSELKKTTEALRESDERFRQAQKMEAVGRLAGGVAHDFNNLLTVINGYSESLLRDEPEGPRRRDLEEVLRAGQRGGRLTRQLLTFSRRQAVAARVLDLSDVVREMEVLLRRLIGENIKLEMVQEPRLGRIKADSGQLEQVIMNLAVNARDAMPRGGTLTLETANAKGDGVRTGPFVAIKVTDTGCGMDAEVIARIFEPFFTTKGVGKGTGLGLAVVYGVVEQCGGRIDVKSAPGKGTTFTLFFPQVDEPLAVKKDPSGFITPTGMETILLVEDESSVRKLAAAILRKSGYQVIESSDGKEALETLKAERPRIDLLITDLVMPEIGGRELVQRLRPDHPRLKVIYMSGYAEDAQATEGLVGANATLFEKPFTMGALTRKVREVLDRNRSSRLAAAVS